MHPDTPTEGRSMEEIYGPRGIDAKAAQDRMKGLMAEEGLPYGDRTHTYNSRLAQELGIWVDSLEGYDQFHDGVFKAYFVEGLNISDPEVLLNIVEKVGLDRDEAEKVLKERTYKDAVDADWAKSRDYGVTGVPTYVANGYGVVGAQPYDALEQFLDKLNAPRRES